MKKLLITGFDPFGGETVNPAWEAVKLLPDRIGEYRLYKLQIPTVFGIAGDLVIAEAQKLCPDAVIAVGQAGGRGAVTPERVAINLLDARIPDNAGNQPEDQAIAADGPAAYFSTLPVKRMAEAIRKENLPGAVSYTAGTFVCNDVLYRLLHHFNGTQTGVCFIHVPFLPEQGEPNLPLQSTVKALEAAIACI